MPDHQEKQRSFICIRFVCLQIWPVIFWTRFHTFRPHKSTAQRPWYDKHCGHTIYTLGTEFLVKCTEIISFPVASTGVRKRESNYFAVSVLHISPSLLTSSQVDCFRVKPAAATDWVALPSPQLQAWNGCIMLHTQKRHAYYKLE